MKKIEKIDEKMASNTVIDEKDFFLIVQMDKAFRNSITNGAANSVELIDELVEEYLASQGKMKPWFFPYFEKLNTELSEPERLYTNYKEFIGWFNEVLSGYVTTYFGIPYDKHTSESDGVYNSFKVEIYSILKQEEFIRGVYEYLANEGYHEFLGSERDKLINTAKESADGFKELAKKLIEESYKHRAVKGISTEEYWDNFVRYYNESIEDYIMAKISYDKISEDELEDFRDTNKIK